MSSWIKVGGGIKRRKGKGADRQRVPERLSGDGNASLTGAYGKGEYLYFLTNYFFRKQNKISLAPQQVQQLDKAPHFKQRQQTHNVCGQGALPTSKIERQKCEWKPRVWVARMIRSYAYTAKFRRPYLPGKGGRVGD